MDRNENLDNIIRQLAADTYRAADIPPSLKEKQVLMRALMNLRTPQPPSEEFLKMQDYELQFQLQEKGIVEIPQTGIVLWKGDITRLKVDAIVNAANSDMLGCFSPLHNCIDNCIHSAAGIQLREECQSIMRGRKLATSKAVITKGYNLPASHVIHTVGPIILTGSPSDNQCNELADCYRNCLTLAEENQLTSIAFCCISTGVFRFPNELAAQIAVKTVREFPKQSIKTVIFNVFIKKDYDIYKRLLG